MARKRLPDDVREEYGRLYGAQRRGEIPRARQHQAAGGRAAIPRVEGRNGRAHCRHSGAAHGRRDTANAPAGPRLGGRMVRMVPRTTLAERRRLGTDAATRSRTRCARAVGEKRWEENHPDELWEQGEELRQAVRPVLADVGETSQFLATKALVLNNEAREQFLDFLYRTLPLR